MPQAEERNPGAHVPLPDLSAGEFLRWVLRLRRRFRITGASMFPILKPGDEVLLDMRAYRRRQPEVGEIVVARHPTRGKLLIIKRVASVHPDSTVNLQAENPFEGTDYHNVPSSTIIGKVACVFSRGNPVKSTRKPDR